MLRKLEEYLESRFGTRQSKGELYAGFFLIVAGVVLATVGLIFFVSMATRADAASYAWRETGGVIATLGPPAILVGISVTLPTRWTMRVLDAVGILLCLSATGLFVALYPARWNTGTGDEIWGAVLYVAGLAALLSTTLTSLIGYYVARTAAGGAPPVVVNAPEYNYDIPDAVIERDIELVARRQNLG